MKQKPLPNVGRKREPKKRVSKGPPKSPKNYKKIKHVSNEVDRTATGLLERTFAEEWIKENEVHPGVNAGYGTLQGLFFERTDFGSFYTTLEINQRDATIAATVVQWLGTNCGYAFLSKCLKKVGLDIIERENIPDRYSYSDEVRSRVAGAYDHFIRDFVPPSKRLPKVASFPIPKWNFELNKKISERKPGHYLAIYYMKDAKRAVERLGGGMRLDQFAEVDLRRRVEKLAEEESTFLHRVKEKAA